MTPREKIAAVCLLLEDVIGGLPGNGRFDDDPKMRAVSFDDQD